MGVSLPLLPPDYYIRDRLKWRQRSCGDFGARLVPRSERTYRHRALVFWTGYWLSRLGFREGRCQRRCRRARCWPPQVEDGWL